MVTYPKLDNMVAWYKRLSKAESGNDLSQLKALRMTFPDIVIDGNLDAFLRAMSSAPVREVELTRRQHSWWPYLVDGTSTGLRATDLPAILQCFASHMPLLRVLRIAVEWESHMDYAARRWEVDASDGLQLEDLAILFTGRCIHEIPIANWLRPISRVLK